MVNKESWRITSSTTTTTIVCRLFRESWIGSVVIKKKNKSNVFINLFDVHFKYACVYWFDSDLGTHHQHGKKIIKHNENLLFNNNNNKIDIFRCDEILCSVYTDFFFGPHTYTIPYVLVKSISFFLFWIYGLIFFSVSSKIANAYGKYQQQE